MVIINLSCHLDGVTHVHIASHILSYMYPFNQCFGARLDKFNNLMKSHALHTWHLGVESSISSINVEPDCFL